MTVAADQMGSAATDAELVRRLLECRQQQRMIGEAKIIITAEVDQSPTIDYRFAARRRLLLQTLAVSL